jgi:hypothetical protein
MVLFSDVADNLTSLTFTETSTFVTSRKNCRQDFREQFRFRFVSTLLASRGGHWAGENPNHTTAKSEVFFPLLLYD